MPAAGIAEVIAEGGGSADGGAVGRVDGALSTHVVGVTLDHVAIGQVMQAHHAPLPIASHTKFLVVAAVDHDQRIDLIRVDVFLDRSAGGDSGVVFRNQIRPSMHIDPMFEGAAIASDLLPNSQAADIAIFVKPRHPSGRSVGRVGIHRPPSIIPGRGDVGMQLRRVPVQIVRLRESHTTHRCQTMSVVVTPSGIAAVAIDIGGSDATRTG